MKPEQAIQLQYVDALGAKHRPSRATVDAIRAAMRVGGALPAPGGKPAAAGRATPAAADPLVVTEGEATRLGPATVTLEDGTTLRVESSLPADVPAGYHRIQRDGRGPAPLIVAPAACHLPDDYKAWGWAIQLYAARSRRSWGIGDLADLRRLGSWGTNAGASIALVNPLSSATPILPQHASPYFPSSRRFRNPLYLRVGEMDGARGTPGLDALATGGRALNRGRLIDRDEIFPLKLKAFEKVWRRVRRARDERFDRYLSDQGAPLTEYATFSALAERFGKGWHGWPAAYRRPDAAAVRRAIEDPTVNDRVRFHAWLQFQIDRQLERASATMQVMQDLPIGFDPDGADAWAFQSVLADGVSVGAPPDEFNTRGQNWGLPPFVPHRLREAAYEPFIQTIRACLRHAGGLRIDHVMGFFRLFWIPRGMEPKDGAYVRNAPADLLAIVALESRRARAVIVGEDLGTVEKEARAELMKRKVLSYRLLWFEKEEPRAFPRQAVAAVTTHDLPTIAGLWTGSDLAAQKRLGLEPNEAGTAEIRSRVAKMTRATARTPVATVIVRVHEALSEAPSRIVTATLDDALGVEERPNMPATTHEWPNWSLALPQPIERIEKSALAARIAKALARGRRKYRTKKSGVSSRSSRS